MVKYSKKFERNRSKARRYIARAYQCAAIAAGLIGADRGAMRVKGMSFIRLARDTWAHMPVEMSLAAQCALYPNDTRTAAHLANIRSAKYGYTVKSQW